MPRSTRSNSLASVHPVNREDLETFIRTLFLYADNWTFVLLRAFVDGESRPWCSQHWRAIQISEDGLETLVNAALHLAQHCADADKPVTFCPPVATFSDARTASERTLANGLVLLVELDDNALAGRVALEQILGPVTLIVESGGTYTDLATGDRLPRLHLYWRLAKPTRMPAEHALLKELRRIAQCLTGSDATAVPNCHPIRWPGSWHRKAEPRLARIVELNPDVEIDLATALDQLSQAAALAGITFTSPGQATGNPQAPIEDVRSALAVIPNDDTPWKGWSDTAMAIWRSTGASEDGREAFHEWSKKSGKYDFSITDEKWDHLSRSPPTLIGWRALERAASKADRTWRSPSLERAIDETLEPIEEEEEPKAGALNLYNPSHFQAYEIPERRWLVEDWIPMDRATGLNGAGGEGKTLLAQMLATACALGKPWLGLPVKRCRSILLFCEDDLDEMLRRQADINRFYECTFVDLDAMRWEPRLGENNTLMTFNNGQPERTSLFDQVLQATKDFGAELLFTDTLADVFAGNENDRSQARAFVQQGLAYMAREIKGAVIAPAHPSRAGIREGTGESGSTAWDGTFRARLYLTTPRDENRQVIDQDVRVLTKMKINAARRGETIELRWRNGVLVPTMPPIATSGPDERRTCEAVFLSLLDKMASEGQYVSHKPNAGNYAPRLFASRPERERFTKKDFATVMQTLFARRLITVGQYWDSSRRPTDCITRIEL
jgi:RecA-family ATPase